MSSPSESLRNSRIYTFEEAIALAKCKSFQWELLFTCGLCFLTLMSQILCVAVILPFVKCDLKASLQQQSVLTSASFFGIVCGSHMMGFLGDTWGRINTLKLSLIGSMIMAVVSVFSVHIWMLIVTRFLTGLFVAGCQSCTYSLCGEFHSDKTRARYVTLISEFFNLSLVFIPLLAVTILPSTINEEFLGIKWVPWRFLLLAINICPVVTLILIFRTPETPKYDLVHGNHERALRTLQEVFKRNTKRPIEEYPVRFISIEQTGVNIADVRGCKDAFKMIWRQTAQIFYKKRIAYTLNIFFVLAVLFGISHGLIMWYPTVLNQYVERKGENLCLVVSEIDISGRRQHNTCNVKMETVTFWFIEILGCFFVVIYLIFAYIINLVGKRNIIIAWSGICGIMCVATPFISNLILGALALTVIASIGTCGGIVATIAVEFYPTNINSTALCLVMMVGRLGATVGSSLFGLIVFNYCEVTFWGLAGVCVIVGVLTWFLPEKKREKHSRSRKS